MLPDVSDIPLKRTVTLNTFGHHELKTNSKAKTLSSILYSHVNQVLHNLSQSSSDKTGTHI